VGWLQSGFPARGAEPRDVVKITADDLASGKVVVIGKLGVPLRQMMSIRGTWRNPPVGETATQVSELLFHVTHIDGKALGEPIDFGQKNVDVTYPLPWDGDDEKARGPTPLNGAAWEIRGYESFVSPDHPPRFDKERNVPFGQTGPRARPFDTELHAIIPRAKKAAKKSGGD
jgi:hypothetical protein